MHSNTSALGKEVGLALVTAKNGFKSHLRNRMDCSDCPISRILLSTSEAERDYQTEQGGRLFLGGKIEATESLCLGGKKEEKMAALGTG